MQSFHGDPAAHGKDEEDDDPCLNEPQKSSEQLIDDAEGRAFFYKPAQTFIEQNGGKLDEDNEEHE